MRAGEQALDHPGARLARGTGSHPVTGEAASAAAPADRAPLFAPARALRAGLLVLAAALGVAASALAFSALWPAGEAAPAPQPERLSPRDAATARAVVARAEGLMSIAQAQLGYRLRVAGPVPGLRGQTDTGTRTITLFVAPTDPAHRVAHDLAHEIGHAFDAQRLTAAQRAAYLRARGVPGAAWVPGGAASDYRSGAGDFAEVFALCHAPSPDYRSRLAVRPEAPCALLPIQARAAKLGEGGS